MNVFLTIFAGVIYLGGTMIHIWTTYIAFMESGLLLAMFTFFMPVLSELGWFIFLWFKYGGILPLYPFVIMLYLLFTGIWFYLSMRAEKIRGNMNL